MRPGQTSAVVFLSSLTGSAIGFLATLYFARLLGAEVLGFYFLSMTLVSWLKIGGNLGVSTAVVKRLSEGSERGAYAGAGLVAMAGFGLLVSVAILAASGMVNRYVGRSVAVFIVGLVLLGLGSSFSNAILNGQRSVHISGLLEPARTVARVCVQVGLVFGGMELMGLLVGQGAGWLVGILLSLIYVKVGVEIPEKRHFVNLYEYAKFSWLGSLKSRAINDVDIVILGLMVPASLVGVYAVVWGIARFLTTFHNAVNQTLFPEISRADADDRADTVEDLVTTGVQYSGLFLLPGFVGGSILADRILRLYGPEFVQGTTVMSVLILSVVFYGYQQQLLNSIEAIDRPDIAFRINVAFVSLNVVANLLFIYCLGWVGAAVASALSTAVGLALSFRALRSQIDFAVPYLEVSKQVVAALVMGAVVYGGERLESVYGVVNHNLVIVFVLVGLGACVYFAVLTAISPSFRITVKRNVDVSSRLLD